MARAAEFNVRIIGRVTVSVIFSFPAHIDATGLYYPSFQLDSYRLHAASDV